MDSRLWIHGPVPRLWFRLCGTVTHLLVGTATAMAQREAPVSMLSVQLARLGVAERSARTERQRSPYAQRTPGGLTTPRSDSRRSEDFPKMASVIRPTR